MATHIFKAGDVVAIAPKIHKDQYEFDAKIIKRMPSGKKYRVCMMDGPKKNTEHDFPVDQVVSKDQKPSLPAEIPATSSLTAVFGDVDDIE